MKKPNIVEILIIVSILALLVSFFMTDKEREFVIGDTWIFSAGDNPFDESTCWEDLILDVSDNHVQFKRDGEHIKSASKIWFKVGTRKAKPGERCPND